MSCNLLKINEYDLINVIYQKIDKYMLSHANAEIQCCETANLLSGRYVNHVTYIVTRVMFSINELTSIGDRLYTQ